MRLFVLQGYSIDWCKGPDRGLIAPDVVFYLEIPLKEASSRGGYGEERYETQSFQENVRLRYSQLKDSTWKVNYKNMQCNIYYFFGYFCKSRIWSPTSYHGPETIGRAN